MKLTADPTQASAPDSDADDSAHAPPRLRRVQIRNYKSIAFCDVSLAPLTILVGRNGAGKSNFLDALSFLRDVLSRGLREALKVRGGWESIHRRGTVDENISIEIELEQFGPPPPTSPEGLTWDSITDEQWWIASIRKTNSESALLKYRFDLGLRSGSTAFISGEHCTVRWACGAKLEMNVAGERLSGEIWRQPSFQALSFPERRLKRLHGRDELVLLELFANPILRVSIETFWSMQFYNFQPEKQRSPQKRSVGGLLERDGANVASVIETTRPHDPRAVERIERYVSAVVPEVVKISVRPLGEYETVAFEVQPDESVPPLEFLSANMSDGTLRTLAAVTAIFQSTPDGAPSLVAIEEPETSLHPAAMRAMAAAFDEGTLRTQILVTTHSPDLLDCEAIQPENIRVVEFVEGATSITELDEASVSIVKDHINTLGGLERDRHLELNLDDLERQAALAAARKSTT